MRFRFITLSLHLAALLAFAVLPSCDKDPLNSGTTSSGEIGSGGNSGENNGENSGENDGGNSGSGDNTGDSNGGNGAAATTAATRPRRAWPMSLTEAVSRKYTSR